MMYWMTHKHRCNTVRRRLFTELYKSWEASRFIANNVYSITPINSNLLSQKHENISTTSIAFSRGEMERKCNHTRKSWPEICVSLIFRNQSREKYMAIRAFLGVRKDLQGSSTEQMRSNFFIIPQRLARCWFQWYSWYPTQFLMAGFPFFDTRLCQTARVAPLIAVWIATSGRSSSCDLLFSDQSTKTEKTFVK